MEATLRADVSGAHRYEGRGVAWPSAAVAPLPYGANAALGPASPLAGAVSAAAPYDSRAAITDFTGRGGLRYGSPAVRQPAQRMLAAQQRPVDQLDPDRYRFA